MVKQNLNPKIGVVKTTPMQRAIGRSLRVEIDNRTGSQGESDLAGDIFNAMWQSDPKLIEKPPSGREVNQAIMRWAMKEQSFQNARIPTTGNLVAAKVATSVMHMALASEDAIKAALQKQAEAEKKKSEAKEKARDAAEKMQEELEKKRKEKEDAKQPSEENKPEGEPAGKPEDEPGDEPGDRPDDEPKDEVSSGAQPEDDGEDGDETDEESDGEGEGEGEGDAVIQALQEALDAAQNEYSAAEAQAQAAAQKIDKLSENPIAKGMMVSAMESCEEKAEEVNAAMAGWGIEPGDVSSQSSEDILDYLQNNTDKLKEIADMGGRLKGFSAKVIDDARNHYTGPASEVKITKNILRLLPTERAALNSPIPLVAAQKKIALFGEGLLGIVPRNEGRKEGNLEIMVDGSGSMCGQNEIFAKAAALGIAKALRDDPNQPAQVRTEHL